MSWLKQHAGWLKWVLAIAILGALVWQSREGLKDLQTRTIGWEFFGLAVLARFGSLCLTFSRWWLLVTGIGLPETSSLGLYNSTGSVSLNINGLGLVSGTTLQIASLFGSSYAVVDSVTGSSGAYATFTSTAFFGAAAGTYTISIATTWSAT